LSLALSVLPVLTRPLNRHPALPAPGEPATFHGRKWATKFVIGGASVLAFLARNRLKPSDA